MTEPREEAKCEHVFKHHSASGMNVCTGCGIEKACLDADNDVEVLIKALDLICGLSDEQARSGVGQKIAYEQLARYRGQSSTNPVQPTCPKCGRTDCTSNDGSGLCGGGKVFDPELEPLKCQIINLNPGAKPPVQAEGPSWAIYHFGNWYKMFPPEEGHSCWRINGPEGNQYVSTKEEAEHKTYELNRVHSIAYAEGQKAERERVKAWIKEMLESYGTPDIPSEHQQILVWKEILIFLEDL